MTLTKDISAKFAVAAVAVAMIFSAYAPAAQAQTTEDLQQMINDLLAQVAGLQANLGQGSTGDSMSSSSVCPYTWTRSLNVGSEGADVMKLQQFLNANADTRVAVSGAGSVGAETMYYGPATAAAVSKMQVMYRSEVLAPAGLVNPTGFFGPSTRAKANSLCTSAPVMEEEEGEEGEEEMEEEGDMTLSGEADLKTFEISEGDDADDLEEGQEDAAVAELEIEFNDGDAEISRIDLRFSVADDGNDDTDVYDNLDEISLWVDGDKVASMDASDEDEYLDEDDGTIRFSGLDIVAMEDEEITVIVAVSMQNNIDGISDDVDMEVSAESIRFFDADGVATTEDSQGDLGGSTAGHDNTETFTVEEEGSNDDLDLASSSNEPDERTLALDEDDNEEYAIFAFELDADDSDGDIELNTLTLDIVVAGGANVDDVVNDFRIEIDGENFDADGYVGTGATVALVFDVDGDFTVDAEETAEVVLFADFEDMDAASLLQGDTIVASITQANVDAEGVDDITVGGSTQNGELQTMRSVGISADFNASESDTSVSGNTVTMEFVVDVTAFGADSVLTVADFNYTVVDPGAAGTVNVTLDATDPSDEDPAGTFTLDEGDSAEYVFKVFITTTAAPQAGLYEVTLDDVAGEVVDEALEDVANFSA
jgi:peptidoglycan hydrolase-like protein with peptidoglycan-binding domain